MARKDTIIKMRDILVRRRDALRKALAGDLSLLKQLPEQTGSDVVDAALDASQDEISSKLAEVESRELGNIERALQRMNEGTYGHCEVCTEKIPVVRLNALPYATMCIACQQADEEGRLEERRVNDWSKVVDTGFTDTNVSVNDFEMQ
ncbi:General stress protein 16O [Pseudobythopirellula maris]|uniref:General stress protein 16O n=1 Tax=Pseudobythopirellula maris TaxID=2527991 RepID=A0A5C5ZJI7_9BACT|nr:TraR/DksA family transcriptional regulator [Pseudobythopirellula maris]TWT87295.1 General stress protein 16O [Pseudobythopirellula maris]